MKKQSIYKYALFLSEIILIGLLVAIVVIVKLNPNLSTEYYSTFSSLVMLSILLSFVIFYLAWKSQLELISIQNQSKDVIEKKNLNDLKPSKNETSENINHIEIIEEICENLKTKPKEEIISEFIRKFSLKMNMGAAIAFKRNNNKYNPIAQWALILEKDKIEFQEGEGVHGQAVKNKNTIRLSNISDSIMIITSSSGKTNPKSLYIIPILIDDKVDYLVEFASFKEDDDDEFGAIKIAADKIQSLLIEKAE